jgi:hypothetical protein
MIPHVPIAGRSPVIACFHSFKSSLECDKYAEFVELCPQRKVKVFEEKAVPVSLSLLKIPREMTRVLTQGRRKV